MARFPIGGQRVGVERDVPVLDDGEQPTFSEYNEPITEPVVVWVDNSLFEVQSPSEKQGATVTTSEPAWAFLPVGSDGVVPAVGGEGEPASFAFFGEDGKPVISSSARLVHDGLRYVLRGDAVLERDIRGRADHVFAVCERQQG